ncbi:Cytochrome c556 [Devosia sp. YR412]|uniref:c-type cytochrome n=1 Tax=Devosia sp. YR412 TaxID=1881030 RepID=UPI0008BAE60E|nr:cytochrome c [Devosia sp. YR412]SEP75437.1 Cytochrome c556 [Devosia sp. YR412]
MSIKKISAMAIAGLMTLGVVATFAQDAFVAPATPEEAVTARKALMRTNGQTLRGAGALTGDQAVAAMQTLLDDYTNMPALFPEGSIVGESEALPAIWENWEGFTAIIETGRAAAESGLAAAQSGDAAGYAAALQAIGGTCGQCHQQFRS